MQPSCKNDGWTAQKLTRRDGSIFKNQGDCTNTSNTGKLRQGSNTLVRRGGSRERHSSVLEHALVQWGIRQSGGATLVDESRYFMPETKACPTLSLRLEASRDRT
jgi:hypothetical protein